MFDTIGTNLIDISDLFLGRKRPRQILRDMQDIERWLTSLLSMITCVKFKWKGLPKELEERRYIIEYILFYYGCGVLVKRNENYYFLPSYLASKLNIYGEPTEVYAYGLNGASFGKVFIRDEIDNNFNVTQKQDAVLFKNNLFSMPQYRYMKPFISRLCYIWQTLGIQNGLSRIRMLVYCNGELAENINDAIENMLGTSSLNIAIPNEEGASIIDDIKETQFGSQYTPQDLWFDFDKTFNLLLSFCGVKNNIEQNKNERQTLREVSGSDYLTRYAEETRLEMRNIAIEQVKEVFGLDLECVDEVEEKVKQEEEERARAFTGGSGVENDQKENEKGGPEKTD